MRRRLGVAQPSAAAFATVGRTRAVGGDGPDNLLRAFDRDADGTIVRRWGGTQPEVFEFGGWTDDLATGVEERLTPEVTLADTGVLQWHLVDIDGTVVVSSRSLGRVEGFRRLRPYGQAYIEGGEPKAQQSFHTHHEEPGLGLTAAGPRHLLRKDGRWLQPEPLLYLGPQAGDLADPRGLATYRYSRNTPTSQRDSSGFNPVALDAMFLAMDLEAADDAHVRMNTAVARFIASPGVETYAQASAATGSFVFAAHGFVVGAAVPVVGGLAHAANRAGLRAARIVEHVSQAGACFVAGTTVAMANGTKAIESIEVGDQVLAHDEDAATDVVASVSRVFVRVAPEVVDAEVEYSDGTIDVVTGTPNHPFWVDAVRDYVPLGELEVGTVLHVQGGGEAVLVSKTWRQGDFEVFDFEVEGLHNFYVRGEGSEAAGVLVHNSTGGQTKTLYRGVDWDHPKVGDALDGRAVPNNPSANATPVEHSLGSKDTQFTSWTSDKSIADEFANGGVVLEKDFPVDAGVPGVGPFAAREKETLIEGVVEGCAVHCGN